MSDAILKSVEIHIEALRRRGQQLNESEVLRVAGIAGHTAQHAVGAQHANRGEAQQTDVNVREIGGYGFATTAQPVSPTPRVLPGPADIPPTGQGPATPSGQGSVGLRSGAANGVDAACRYSGAGGSGRE